MISYPSEKTSKQPGSSGHFQLGNDQSMPQLLTEKEIKQ